MLAIFQKINFRITLYFFTKSTDKKVVLLFSISCCSRLHPFTNFLFLPLAVAPNGSPIVEMPNSDIPVSVIHNIDELLTSGLTLEDAVTNLRGSLVPPGHEPYPFRTNTAESLLDKLRSVVASYTFCKRVEELKEQGVDF